MKDNKVFKIIMFLSLVATVADYIFTPNKGVHGYSIYVLTLPICFTIYGLVFFGIYNTFKMIKNKTAKDVLKK